MTKKQRSIGDVSRIYEKLYQKDLLTRATAHHRLAVEFLPFVHKEEIVTCLDFACGRGVVLRELIAQGFLAIGTEVCEYLLNRDLAKLPVYPYSVNELSNFDPGKFDMVFAVDVLDQLRSEKELDEFLGHAKRFKPKMFFITIGLKTELTQIDKNDDWWTKKVSGAFDAFLKFKKFKDKSNILELVLWL